MNAIQKASDRLNLMDETFTLNVCCLHWINQSICSISCWATEHEAVDCTARRIAWPNYRVSRFSTFAGGN